jgi:Arc/MetJ family transcription regulator
MYGCKYGHMKTTVELDETKVQKIMRLTGINTMKEAVDWALYEALRIAKISRIAEAPWDAEFLKDAVDPNYDVIQSRRAPVNYRDHAGGRAKRRGAPKKAARIAK